MKYFDWDPEKNEKLQTERGVSFEEILTVIEDGGLLIITYHPNQKKYPNQMIFVVNLDDYAYMIPFVEDEEKIFLKTIIPSRKMTRIHIIDRRSE